VKHQLLSILLVFCSLTIWAENGVRITPIDVPGGRIEFEVVGDQCTLTPVPNSDYAFQLWLDDASAPEVRTIDLTQLIDPSNDVVYQVAFVHQPSVIFPEGTVAVTVDDATIPSYELQTIPSHTTTPFSCWSNGVVTNPLVYRETMGCIIPRFGGLSAQTWDCPGGKVIFSTGETQYEIAAQANEDYLFQSWLDGNTDNPRFVDVTGITGSNEVTYQAVFVHQPSVHFPEGNVSVAIADQSLPSFSLTTTPSSSLFNFSCWSTGHVANPLTYQEKQGQVTPRFNGLSIDTLSGPGGRIVYAVSGNSCQIQAVPNQNYVFQSWLDGNTTNPRTVNVSGISGSNESWYKAVFVHQPSVHFPEGDVTVAIADQTLPSFSLTTTPSSSLFNFSCWSTGHVANPLTYKEKQGQVTPRFNGLSIDTLSGPGGSITYAVAGTTCTVEAIANTDYEFQQWVDGNTDNPRDIDVSAGSAISDASYKAVFVHQPSVMFTRGNVDVTVADQSIPSFTLSMAENCSYNTFSCWSNGLISNSISYLEKNGNIIPRFKKALPEYDDPAPEAGHIDYEEIDCNYKLTAVPEFGYTFVHWEDNSTSAERVVPLDEADYIATFMEVSYTFKVGTQYYSTASEALAAVVAGGGVSPLEVLTDVAEDLTINSDVTIQGNGHAVRDLIIQQLGSVHLQGELTINDLYLNATTGKSSQLFDVANLTYQDAYIDIQLEATKSTASDKKWYAISVPFEVNGSTGITRASGAATTPSDYVIYEYDGQMRADNKNNGWVKLYQPLYAGLFYMFGIEGNENVWRFKKTAGKALGGSTTVQIKEYASNFQNRGWNAMGNTQLTHANVSIPDINYVQVFDNASATGKYEVCNLKTTSFVVASPFFVQAIKDDFITYSEATHSSLQSPRRSGSDDEDILFEVKLSNNQLSDRMYVSSSPDATNTYQIGSDLVKMLGGSSEVYIWSNAYSQRLCAQDAPMVDGVATYNISLYAPTSGEYVLSASGESTLPLYLTLNGFPIWTLSESNYTVNLPKGTSQQFGLQIGDARNTPTNIDAISSHLGTEKVIYHGNLFIIREGQVYNAQGALVK